MVCDYESLLNELFELDKAQVEECQAGELHLVPSH